MAMAENAATPATGTAPQSTPSVPRDVRTSVEYAAQRIERLSSGLIGATEPPETPRRPIGFTTGPGEGPDS